MKIFVRVAFQNQSAYVPAAIWIFDVRNAHYVKIP